jgi:glutamate racemase
MPLARDVAEGQAGGPVIGLIGAAAAMVQTHRVGVLATPATVASEAYRSSIEALHPGTLVVEQACPAFVPMIESGDLSSDELRRIAQEYLKPMLKASVESIVLGCTHYPLLVPLLRQLLPASVQLIDPAVGCGASTRCGSWRSETVDWGTPSSRRLPFLCHG